MKKNLLMTFAISLAVLSAAPLAAQKGADLEEKPEGVMLPETGLIDVPTAGILDYYGFLIKTRFYSEGGVLGSLNFGVLERLNLGASMTVDRLVGSDSPVRMVRPEIQVRYRFHDGDYYVPAMAVGFDGQGYFYRKALKKYMEKGRGMYVVGSKEYLLPGLMFHGGLNVPDFDDGYIFGFLAANYTIGDKVAFMFEYDNLFHSDVPKRVNFGARFFVTPYFHIDAAMRDIGASEDFSDGSERNPERIVQMRYTTSF